MLEENKLLDYKIKFKKCFFFKDNKEIIYLRNGNIIKAKLDESNSLKDEIILFESKHLKKHLVDFVPISDDKVCIIYNLIGKENNTILIKSLKDNITYEIPNFYNCDNYKNLEVIFFQEKNQIIIIDNFLHSLHFWKFNEDINNYTLFFKLFICQQFKINILNKNTIIIAIKDCLLVYDTNSFRIKRKIYYDDEEKEIEEENNNINNEDEDEYDEDIGTQGNYINDLAENKCISSCLSEDKKYLIVSNINGRLIIYNTKNFKKEKIKKFKNYIFDFETSYQYSEEELEKIDTIRMIDNIKVFDNFFILRMEYAISSKNHILNYKKGLIPLKKIGKIWKFQYLLD